MKLIRFISQERFNAYVCWTRLPLASIIGEEIQWYSTKNDRILGVIIYDRSDNNFAYIVLARDEADRFRCIDNNHSFGSKKLAKIALKKSMSKHHYMNNKSYYQYDHNKRIGIDLFSPVVEESKFNPYFKHLLISKHAMPARKILSEMMHNFIDVDYNFVKEFQTSGFNSRTWELYLYAFLVEQGFNIDKSYVAPDYNVEKFGEMICIEAVTVNSNDKTFDPYERSDFLKGNNDPQEIIAKYVSLLENKIPIKFGSTLFSKLNKEKPYWEMPHVKDKSFLIAIADFHEPQSMMWTQSGLFRYLFGISQEPHYEQDGTLKIVTKKIDTHFDGDTNKQIPSGFFFQPKAENISGVLFSATGTLSKFTRMGALAGFIEKGHVIYRGGLCYTHDPNSVTPTAFYFEVKAGKIKETWSEGMELFHNPKARIPVDKDMFPNIAHHFFDGKNVLTYSPEFHPISSMTYNITVKSSKSKK